MKLNLSFIKIFTKFVIKYTKPKNWISRKYTESDYIKELIKLLKSNMYWRRYDGLINGRVLNNKHHQYIKHFTNIY